MRTVSPASNRMLVDGWSWIQTWLLSSEKINSPRAFSVTDTIFAVRVPPSGGGVTLTHVAGLFGGAVLAAVAGPFGGALLTPATGLPGVAGVAAADLRFWSMAAVMPIRSAS